MVKSLKLSILLVPWHWPVWLIPEIMSISTTAITITAPSTKRYSTAPWPLNMLKDYGIKVFKLFICNSLMLLDNLSLAFLVRELNPLLENAFVNKVSQLEKGVLKIKLHTKQGSKDLILAPNAFYVSSYSMPATHKKSNFTASLRKELYNKRITAIEQHDFDRVVALKFLEHSLVLELLGEGNMALLDSEGKIISCLKNESWSDREVRKGAQYSYPQARGLNPLEITAEKLSGIFSSSEKDAVRTLISALNISPPAAEEILFALKIDKGLKASALTKKDCAAIAEKVKDFYSAEKSSASGAFAY